MKLYRILIIFISIFIFPSITNAAGIATHLSHLIRIIDNEETNTYSPWLKTGTFLPDALYSCLPNHEWEKFAEFTHWPNFIIISINYWNEKYGNDETSVESHDSFALKSFIKGVFIHQIVDVSWHSLVTDYENNGLLNYITQVEFNGDIKKAHNFIDTFGDLYTLHSWVKSSEELNSNSWEFFKENNWKLPIETDLMEIVERSNIIKPHGITYSNLKYCIERGYSALITEIMSMKIDRKTILKNAMKRYPQIIDLLKDYPMGGEWDNIVMIRNCINHLNQYFQMNSVLHHELNEETLKLCGNLPSVPNTLNVGTYPDDKYILQFNETSTGANIISPWNSFSNFGSSMVVGNFLDDGELYIAVSSPLEDNGKGGVYMIPFSITKTTIGNQPFSKMFGSRLDKFPLGNIDFLIVSEPGANTFKFFIGQDIILIVTLPVTPEMKQFKIGTVTDINGDEIPDILLSAEYSGDKQQGDVYFIDGQNLLYYILNGKRNQIIDLRTLTPISLKNKILLDDYSHFGGSVSVSSSDFSSKRIFISAPNTNKVIVVEYQQNIGNFIPQFVIKEDHISLFDRNKKFTKTISKENGLFGKKIYTWLYEDHHFIAITQPLFNIVYIYEDLPFDIVFLGKITLQFSLDEITYNMNFGEDVVFNEVDNHLYISSPNSFGGRGAIFNIDCQELLLKKYFKKIELSKDNLYFTNMASTSKGYSGFGKTLITGPDGRIIVGVPQYGYGNELKQQLTGAIMVI